MVNSELLKGVGEFQDGGDAKAIVFDMWEASHSEMSESFFNQSELRDGIKRRIGTSISDVVTPDNKAEWVGLIVSFKEGANSPNGLEFILNDLEQTISKKALKLLHISFKYFRSYQKNTKIAPQMQSAYSKLGGMGLSHDIDVLSHNLTGLRLWKISMVPPEDCLNIKQLLLFLIQNQPFEKKFRPSLTRDLQEYFPAGWEVSDILDLDMDLFKAMQARLDRYFPLENTRHKGFVQNIVHAYTTKTTHKTIHRSIAALKKHINWERQLNEKEVISLKDLTEFMRDDLRGIYQDFKKNNKE